MTQRFAQTDKILESFNYDASKLIPILQQVQDVYRYLPEDVMRHIAGKLHISPAKVFGVATFFAHFAITPKGKHIVKVCNGTACHVKGASPIITVVKNKLKLTGNKETTDDGLFTLECVSCLGACGLAPVMVIDDTVHGQMTPDKVNKLIDEILVAEKQHA